MPCSLASTSDTWDMASQKQERSAIHNHDPQASQKIQANADKATSRETVRNKQAPDNTHWREFLDKSFNHQKQLETSFKCQQQPALLILHSKCMNSCTHRT